MEVIPTEHAAVASYQIYAYQESSAAPHAGLWKKVGEIAITQVTIFRHR